MVEIVAFPYVPGRVQGSISRHHERDGAVLIVPSSAISLECRAAGLVVVEGAMFSHPMLALLAKGIPTVIVTAEQAATLQNGQQVQLDGYRGTIKSVSAGTPVIPERPVIPPFGKAVLSTDGVAVSLRASVHNAAGAKQAKELGAESIGLVRTEFIQPRNGKVPGRSFYQQAFGELMTVSHPLNVTLRLLDVAADKLPAWLPGERRGVRSLGRQGVRLFKEEPVRSIVSAQLDAVIKSETAERVRLLVPYITTLEEMEAVKALIHRRVAVPVGAMIETPAAALEIAVQLEVADFAAIGTNDLMQCLFAADRDDPALRRYLDPYSPMLYRFLAQVAKEAGDQLSRVQVCGLLSQLPGVLPVMLGLGFRAFSVDSAYIPYLAATVRETNIGDCKVLAQAVCGMKTNSEVRARLKVKGDERFA